MFTGIIEEVGTVEAIRRGVHSAVLRIHAETVLESTRVGDSIAVNGICLTVTGTGSGSFTADVMHETLDRSALAVLRAGSGVNLERAMPAGGRFGGHIVSGHADGIGTVRAVRRDDTAVWYTVQAAPQLLRYIVEKGSVAVNGVSLTVAGVTRNDFSVSVIPHTLRNTVLKSLAAGDPVNLETDIIGKYVEKVLTAGQDRRAAAHRPADGGITRDFLSANGF